MLQCCNMCQLTVFIPTEGNHQIYLCTPPIQFKHTFIPTQMNQSASLFNDTKQHRNLSSYTTNVNMAHTVSFYQWLEYESSTLTRFTVSHTDSILSFLTTTIPQTRLSPLPDSSSATHSEEAHKTISKLDCSCRILDPSPQGRLGH